jgi:putative ABC transport system substrate-binding protein
MGDPVGLGLVANLAQPGGNLTGLSQGFGEDIMGKWLELLQETVPRLTNVAVLADLGNPISREQAKRLQAIAPTRGLKVRIIDIHELDQLDRTYAQAAHVAQAVLLYADARLIMQQQRILQLSAKHHLPDLHAIETLCRPVGCWRMRPTMLISSRARRTTS